MTTITISGANGADGLNGQDATNNPYVAATNGTDGGIGLDASDIFNYGTVVGAFVPDPAWGSSYTRLAIGGNGGRGGKGGNDNFSGPAGQNGDGGDGASASSRLLNIEFSGQLSTTVGGFSYFVFGSRAVGGYGGDGNTGSTGRPNSNGGNGGNGGAGEAGLDSFTINLSGDAAKLNIFVDAGGGVGGDSLATYSGTAPIDNNGGHGGDAMANLDNVLVTGTDNGDEITLSVGASGQQGGSSRINALDYGTGLGGNGGSATAKVRFNTVQSGAGADLVTLAAVAFGGEGGQSSISANRGTYGSASVTISDNTVELGENDDELRVEAVVATLSTSKTVTVTGNIFDGGAGIDVLRLFGQNGTLPNGVDFSMALNTVTNFERVVGSDYNDAITGDGAANTIEGSYGFDVLKGGGGDDVLNGGADNDDLYGEAGNDTLKGGTGADDMFGGGGNDIYNVDNAGDTVSELTSGGANAGGVDVVYSTVSFTLPTYVENLILTGTAAIDGTGNASNNAITGTSGANVLRGGDGNDTLNGLGGADTLYGGGGGDVLGGGGGNDLLIGFSGADTLTGGANADTFRFVKLEISALRDTITDFVHGLDRVEIDRAAFTAFGADPAGALNPAAFKAGAAATTADHHVIYDQATGSLYYDSDGTGGSAKVLMALFTTKPVLDAGDFFLI